MSLLSLNKLAWNRKVLQDRMQSFKSAVWKNEIHNTSFRVVGECTGHEALSQLSHASAVDQNGRVMQRTMQWMRCTRSALCP